MEVHPELFDADYWRSNQQDVLAGRQADVFPYPRQIRFERPEHPLTELPVASFA